MTMLLALQASHKPVDIFNYHSDARVAGIPDGEVRTFLSSGDE
jgi:hypothetical protein